jgi:hypothetical protein
MTEREVVASLTVQKDVSRLAVAKKRALSGTALPIPRQHGNYLCTPACRERIPRLPGRLLNCLSPAAAYTNCSRQRGSLLLTRG